MGLFEQNLLHFEAVRWYYKIVAGQGSGVPAAVFRHIRQCLICRRRVQHLQGAVTGAGGEPDAGRSDMTRDIIDTLRLHFGCLNERITCSRVKPFLPGLLLPAVQIRIPTPITVHLDHCPECARDLKALRDLGLQAEQLERLERFYQAVPAEVSGIAGPKQRRLCRRARPHTAAFVRGSLDGIDGEILNHLCTCSHCRQRVRSSRQMLIRNCAAPAGEGSVACADNFSVAQLFDCAFPYNRPATDPEQAGAAHVQGCPSCLSKIQMLDNTVHGIAERTDAGVATIYQTQEDAEPAQRGGVPARVPEEIAELLANPYAEYPIQVQVLHDVPEQAAASQIPLKVKAALRRTACNREVRFLLKTAVAVAAVLVLAVFFQGITSTTSGVTFAQVCNAFGEAENIYLARSYPQTGQLLIEAWVSRRTGVILTARKGERTLYDLDAKKKHVWQTSGVANEVTNLSEGEYADSRRLVDSWLGITPIDIPSDATWTRTGDNVSDGSQTYELTYSEQVLSGVGALRKLRVTLDPTTRLPREVERFRRLASEDEWRYQEAVVIQYLTEDEIGKAFEKQGLHRGQ